MNLTQAETAIYTQISEFLHPNTTVLIDNQPIEDGEPFTPFKDKPWCRVSINYGDSRIVAIGSGPCKRNFGIISIQCFVPKNTGTLDMTALCDAWDAHLKNFESSHLQVQVVHAPQTVNDADFYAKIIRAEFTVH